MRKVLRRRRPRVPGRGADQGVRHRPGADAGHDGRQHRRADAAQGRSRTRGRRSSPSSTARPGSSCIRPWRRRGRRTTATGPIDPRRSRTGRRSTSIEAVPPPRPPTASRRPQRFELSRAGRARASSSASWRSAPDGVRRSGCDAAGRTSRDERRGAGTSRTTPTQRDFRRWAEQVVNDVIQDAAVRASRGSRPGRRSAARCSRCRCSQGADAREPGDGRHRGRDRREPAGRRSSCRSG